MLGIHHYGLFVVAGILLNLTPGQDTMFILGRSISGGARSGVAAALGICAGTACHTLAAALGLSAILAASPAAFGAVKLIGAAYLVFLGIRLLMTKRAGVTAPAAAANANSAFRQGMLTNVLNPKVALFFIAFLPQFIDPTSHAKTTAFLLLGASFIATGLLWSLVLALGAARLRAFLTRNPRAHTWIDRGTGGLFVLLGVRLAWAR